MCCMGYQSYLFVLETAAKVQNLSELCKFFFAYFSATPEIFILKITATPEIFSFEIAAIPEMFGA